MPSDRRSRPRRFRRQASPEVAPEVVLEEMEAATQSLREQAWKINATTRTPLISESEIAPVDVSADSVIES